METSIVVPRISVYRIIESVTGIETAKMAQMNTIALVMSLPRSTLTHVIGTALYATMGSAYRRIGNVISTRIALMVVTNIAHLPR